MYARQLELGSRAMPSRPQSAVDLRARCTSGSAVRSEFIMAAPSQNPVKYPGDKITRRTDHAILAYSQQRSA